MRSGIRNHQQQSDDPRCQETRTLGIGDVNGMEDSDFKVDLRGDFFGDYDDYSPEEFGLAPVEDEHQEILTHNEDTSENNEDDDDDDDDDESELEGAYETSLEPNRLPTGPNPTPPNIDDAEDNSVTTQPANRLRGGADVELNNKPYVVKFSTGKAGAVYTNHNIDRNTYITQIGNPENPFSPFSSKIEWEIAHWAKTRGPSSTAFTELMSIEGVSGITIYKPLEANNTTCGGPYRCMSGLDFLSRTHQN
jgi:hypothetical protein